MGHDFVRLVLGAALAGVLAVTGCAAPAEADDADSSNAAATSPPGPAPADVAATAATRTVFANLHSFDFGSSNPFDHRVLVGQQESDVSNRSTNGLAVVASDIANLAGRPPALVSYELSNADKGSMTVFDAAAFRRGRGALRERILGQHKRGVLVSLVWHLRCPKKDVNAPDKFGGADCPDDYRLEELLERKSNGERGAHFTEWRAMLDELTELLFSLKDENGQLIPVQIRPFHEFTGDWFWWGRTNGAASYASAYREMVSYLREGRGLHSVLWVFCPAGPADGGANFRSFYPGDAYVDVVAFDRYDVGTKTLFGRSDFARAYESDLQTIGDFARAHGKVAAVAEVGTDLNRKGFSDTTWFSHAMLEPLKAPNRKFAYVAIWRNAPWEKFVPEPGDGPIADDFKRMSSDGAAVFAGQHDLYTPLHVDPSKS
jgi:mannan endo-1,4-beta-mannosidase